MTSAENYQSKEVRALKTINSSKYPETNKDLEKNIRRLNSSVDYIAAYMITMQKGIDDAGKNFIEQIQSFINDIIVLFAGGEPTGIDVGDLKYILQAIGALFGFGGSPFPINLLEAAQHFIFGYVVPLESFTDLLFNTIEAWLIEAGMPQSLIDAVRGFFDAINDLGDEFGDLFSALGGIFNIFGISNDTGPFADLWNAIEDLFSNIILPSLKPILELIANWTTPFVEALGWVVQQVANIIDMLGDTIDWLAEDFNVGAALSSFFQRLGDIIGVIVSGPVAFIQSLIENLFDGFAGIVDFVGDIISGIFGATGFNLSNAVSMFNQIGDIFNGLVITPITTAIGNIFSWFNRITGNFFGIFGGQDPNSEDFDINQANLTTKVQKVTDMGQAMWDGWHSSDPGGGPADPVEKAQQIMESVQDALIGGWFVETKTSSGTWPVDRTKNKIRLILFPGGEDGNEGGTYKGNTGGTANGGSGGRASGPLVVDLNIADITEENVNYIVSSGNSVTSFGSYASIAPGAKGGFSSSEFPLYVPHDSGSGAGGRGGHVTHGTSAGNGINGGSSAEAAGGDGGAGQVGVSGAVGQNGTNGSNANLASQTKCAGGAGGGGGGCSNTAAGFNNAHGGDGGDGGYPSGPGGGGGAGAVSLTGGVASGGAGGLGAVGVLFIMTQ